MGIPGFFGAWLSKDVPNAVLRNNFVVKDVASLALDLNGEIYAAIDSVYGAGAARLVDVSEAELERLFLSNLSSLIMEHVTKFQPQSCLIIAVDGVVPAAKLQQQKQRRAGVSGTSGSKIGSHHITPGTEMMRKIHASLESFIKLYRAQLPPKVIYSSYLVPGEAEHKIMDLYREGAVFDEFKSKKDHHILCGLDADLIILSLVCPIDNIIIFRDRKSDMVNVEELKKFLLQFAPGPETPAVTASAATASAAALSVYNDFCIIMLLIGNDFLPHMPSLENIADGINYMLEVYKESSGNFAGPGVMRKSGTVIQWTNLHTFLQLLSDKEGASLVEQYGRSKNKSQLMTDNITNNKFNFTGYRDSWYNRALLSYGDTILQERLLRIINRSAVGDPVNRVTMLREFNPNKVKEMVHAYLRSIAWVFLYYKQGMKAVNHDLLYPYYYTPLLRDISDFTRQLSEKEDIFGYRQHPAMIEFTTLHQLVAVLPRSAVKLLPEELQPLFGLDSPLLDMYPQEYKIDMDGKLSEHTGVVIIPFVDKNRIYEAVEQINFERERAELWKSLDNDITVGPAGSGGARPAGPSGPAGSASGRPKIVVGDPENYAARGGQSGRGTFRGASTRGSGTSTRGSGAYSRGAARGAYSGASTRGSGAYSRGTVRGASSGASTRGSGAANQVSVRGSARGISNLIKPGVKRNPLPEIDF